MGFPAIKFAKSILKSLGEFVALCCSVLQCIALKYAYRKRVSWRISAAPQTTSPTDSLSRKLLNLRCVKYVYSKRVSGRNSAKVSLLLNLRCEIRIELTFENLCRGGWRYNRCIWRCILRCIANGVAIGLFRIFADAHANVRGQLYLRHKTNIKL